VLHRLIDRLPIWAVILIPNAWLIVPLILAILPSNGYAHGGDGPMEEMCNAVFPHCGDISKEHEIRPFAP